MKRDENLHPLSWEHHSGLVIARRIQRELAKGIEVNLIAAYTMAMWQEHLRPHFETEEELLLPLMKQYGADRTLTQRLREEHKHFREWVRQIESAAEAEFLSQFADALTAHIRFEEGDLFPHAEKVIPQDALRSLGERLHGRYVQKSTHWEPASHHE